MKLLRKYWYLVVGLVVLVIFFYPKYCGRWSSASPGSGYVYHDCECLGLKAQTSPLVMGYTRTSCFGIVTSKRCYEMRCEEGQGCFEVEKPCEEAVTVCSQDDSSNCDRACVSDDDCKWVCGCGCISKDENCIFKDMMCAPPLFDYGCKCVNNICEYGPLS